MKAPKKITATMAIALAEMSERGGELVRWHGGFWTYSGCPWNRETWPHKHRIPDWFITWGTVQALVRRGEVVIKERHSGGWVVRVGLSAASVVVTFDDEQKLGTENSK